MKYEYSRSSEFLIVPPGLTSSGLLAWKNSLDDSDPWKRVVGADTATKTLLLVKVTEWTGSRGKLETLPNDSEGRPLAHEWATDFDVVRRDTGLLIEQVRQGVAS